MISVVALLFSIPVSQGAESVTTALPKNAAVFFIPHQDDEVLTMGAAIRSHVKSGRPTYAVLLTDGGASRICRRDFATRAQCTAFRDKHFINATKALGATPIIPSNRMKDAETTVAGLRNIMRPYAVSGASLKTFTWDHDAHADHKNAGLALKGLNFADSRYYIGYNYLEQARNAGISPISKHPKCTDSQCMAAVQAHKDFGWISVPASFNRAKQGLESHYRYP